MVDELDVHHRSRVAGPGADLDDPRVAAGALREARRDLVEKAVDSVLAAKERNRFSLRRDVGLGPVPLRMTMRASKNPFGDKGSDR